MAHVSKSIAVSRLEKAGITVSVFGDTIYADVECYHCGSTKKIGELLVEDDGTVEARKLEAILQEYEQSAINRR